MTKQPKLRFRKSDHTYFVGRGKDKVQLESVTTFLGRYFEKFDAKATAKKIAAGFRYRNRGKKYLTEIDKKKATQRYWLNEWKNAAEHGTRVHDALENYINGDTSLPSFPEERDEKKFIQGVTWLQTKFNGQEVTFKPEMKIFDIELRLAGTIDLPDFHPGNIVGVRDWKTNKDMPQKNKYKPKLMAKEPLETLHDCAYFKYVMQICIYSYMLERQGYTIGELSIIWLREDNYMCYDINYYDYRDLVVSLFDGDSKI